MESSGALDKVCLKRLKRVWRAQGQAKGLSRSPLASLNSGIAIIG
jgi:hypothetical protein